MKQTIVGRLLTLRSVVFPLLFYMLISLVAQTLLTTIVTYMVLQTKKSGTEFSNTVYEIASQYVLLATAIGACLLSLTISQADRALYRTAPFWSEGHRPLWQLDRLRKEELLRGLSSGVLAALVYLLFFTISGQISYLGVVITSTIGTPVFPLFFVDLLALGSLLVCEEFLFRHKILRALLAQLPPAPAVVLTSALHTLVRHFQFQLTTYDYLNLFSLNLALGYFFVKGGKCQRGLGFILALLCLLHSLGGLPLWGNESPSFFRFKAVTKGAAFISGGNSGPLGGLGLTAILLLFAIGGYVAWKRENEARRVAERHR